MKPTLVTFTGGWGDTSIERVMASAHEVIARDTLNTARATDAFDSMVVVTDSVESLESWGRGVAVELTRPPFHFGRKLWEVVRKYGMESVLYVGGGLPLLSSQQMVEISHQLVASKEIVITNNPYSGDLVGITPADALERIQLPVIDNALPQLLSADAGLRSVVLPKDVTTLLDVDTPTDLAVLSMYPCIGPNLRACLKTLELDTRELVKVTRLLTDHRAEILIAGRVGSYVWSQLEEKTACRCRILSEERGMRADGREREGKVRSILGLYMEQVDSGKLFRRLSELGDAAVIDTRVLFSHMKLSLSASDRFCSDMMRPEEIANPWLREFTQAAQESPIPVVFGGHSLVSGGLLALIDIAWAGTGLVDKA
ncbi:MAG: hypothetical protein ACE5JL_03800 [Dehalococcoidia bacterium]